MEFVSGTLTNDHFDVPLSVVVGAKGCPLHLLLAHVVHKDGTGHGFGISVLGKSRAFAM